MKVTVWKRWHSSWTQSACHHALMQTGCDAPCEWWVACTLRMVYMS